MKTTTDVLKGFGGSVRLYWYSSPLYQSIDREIEKITRKRSPVNIKIMKTHISSKNSTFFTLFVAVLFFAPGFFTQAEAATCGYSYNEVGIVSPSPTPPSCEFSASDLSITEGESTVLSWLTNMNMYSKEVIFIEPDICDVPDSGSLTVSPSETKTYTLYAIGVRNGVYRSASCDLTITVEPPVCDAPAPKAEITYTGDSFVGGYSSWSWSSENKETHSAQTRKYGCDDGSSTDWEEWNPAAGLDVGTDGPWLLDESYAGCTHEVRYTVENACGAVDTDIAHVTIASVVDPNPPMCDSFTASPNSRTGAGNITLDWETTDATEVSISGITGTLPVDGSKTIYVSSDTTWTLTAKNVDGDDITCTASVDIIPPTNEPEPPVCPLTSASGRTIVSFTGLKLRTDNGLSQAQTSIISSSIDPGLYDITLVSWDGYNDRVTVSQPHEQWQLQFMVGGTVVANSAIIGDLEDYIRVAQKTEKVNTDFPLTGTVTGLRAVQPFYPDTSSTNDLYPICAALDVKTSVCSAPAPKAEITYTGDSFVGGYSSWSWSSENKETHSAQTRKYGCDDGSSTDWEEWNPAAGLDVGTDGPWLLDESYAGCTHEVRYTVENACGAVDTEVAHVTIASTEEPGLPSCDAFTASPNSRTGAGNITLDWETTDATEVSISGITGTLPVDGSKTIYVSSDTTWTLTAKGVDGRTNTCIESVDITSGGGGGGSSSPRCELTASDTKITAGEKVTLSWDNKNTNDILLEDNFGKTLVDTEDSDKYDEDEDSIKVSPTKTTTYTLTVIRGSRDRDCDVKITVDGGEVAGISFTGKRYQDVISLATTPYTGFEAGPVLTFLFYLAIGLWSAVIAYALLMKKRSGLAMAGVSASVAAPTATKETFETGVEEEYIPENIPTETDVEEIPQFWPSEQTYRSLEERAHEQYTLISSDGLKYVESQGNTLEEKKAFLDTIINEARGKYPKEGDWLVLNKERILSLVE